MIKYAIILVFILGWSMPPVTAQLASTPTDPVFSNKDAVFWTWDPPGGSAAANRRILQTVREVVGNGEDGANRSVEDDLVGDRARQVA